jgi:succinate-acetate transporter protein
MAEVTGTGARVGDGASERPDWLPAELGARRPFIANAVPVGVAGFALTTFMLGMYTSDRFPAAGAVAVLAVALFYGGLTQFIAGFFALAKGDLFPAAFMTSYGAFWFTYVAMVLYVLPHAGAAASPALAIYLALWTVITVVYTVCTLATNWTVFVAFIVFDIALILVTIGSASGIKGVTEAGGYAEMLLAALAWYIVAAEVINETLGRRIFPLFPFTKPATPQPAG